MNAREVNALFTEAGRIDARMRRNNPEERADMAISWARLLADVPLAAASWALDQHYSRSRDAIMPSDILALAEEWADRMPAPSPVALADGPDWLREHGVNPDEFQARVDAGERPNRILRELGVIEP